RCELAARDPELRATPGADCLLSRMLEGDDVRLPTLLTRETQHLRTARGRFRSGDNHRRTAMLAGQSPSGMLCLDGVGLATTGTRDREIHGPHPRVKTWRERCQTCLILAVHPP